MKPSVICLLMTTLAAVAADRINIAEDEASHSAYNSGWGGGKNSGLGFGAWVLQIKGGGVADSHAGFYVADVGTQSDLDKTASHGKALGLYANGVEHEAAVGFRTLNQPLLPGDAFSLLMECEDFVTKYERDDDKPGVIGFALRTGSASESWDEYEVGARMRFGFEQGETNYQVHDGEASTDTGVPMTPAGVAVTVLMVTPDTYDLEITNLETGETTKLVGRKLAGETGKPIESFAIYNVDGERQDAYFNGFQVSRTAESIGR
ncbi:MAG: hypothetical protein Fur0032_18520 [Terrimicrobiaceae bacterium]